MELASLRWNEANNNRTGSDNSYFWDKFLLRTLPHTDRWLCRSTVSSVKFRGSPFINGGPISGRPVHMRRKFHPTSVPLDAFQHYSSTITRNKHYNQYTAVQVLVFLCGMFKDFLHQSTWKQWQAPTYHVNLTPFLCQNKENSSNLYLSSPRQ